MSHSWTFPEIPNEVINAVADAVGAFKKEAKDDDAKLLWGAAELVLQAMNKPEISDDKTKTSPSTTAEQRASVSSDKTSIDLKSRHEAIEELAKSAQNGHIGDFDKGLSPDAAKIFANSILTGIDIALKTSNGQISSDEATKKLSQVVRAGLIGVGSSAGKLIGQALIPIPGLGAAIGSLIGTVAGQVTYAGGRYVIQNLDDIELWNAQLENSKLIITAANKAQQVLIAGFYLERAQNVLSEEMARAVAGWEKNRQKFDELHTELNQRQRTEQERLMEIQGQLSKIKGKLSS